MNDLRQLPHMLRLLDDDSPVVRDHLARGLAALGEGLPEELRRLGYEADSPEAAKIRELLEPHHRDWLQGAWTAWFTLPEDFDRLEAALGILSEFMNGRFHGRPLRALLDELAESYRAAYPNPTVRSLARWLFRERGFRGAQDDYYDPRNSDLVAVIERREGIPLSLAALYMLVGRRVGLDIEGCNYPKHFLARVRVDDEVYLVDCFDGGRFFRPEMLLRAHPGADASLRAVLAGPVPAEVIVGRVLNNLIRAYEGQGESDNRALMEDLRRALETGAGGRASPLGPGSRS